MTIQYSLEVPWLWQGCHTPGNLDHDPVKPFWMPSTYQVPTRPLKILGKLIKWTNSTRTKSPGGKWAYVHKNQDLADLLPILEALSCMQPVSSILPLPFLTVHLPRSQGSPHEAIPQLICTLGTSRSFYHYVFLQHIVALSYIFRLRCTCIEAISPTVNLFFNP